MTRIFSEQTEVRQGSHCTDNEIQQALLRIYEPVGKTLEMGGRGTTEERKKVWGREKSGVEASRGKKRVVSWEPARGENRCGWGQVFIVLEEARYTAL